ncbi:MAG: sigma-54 dependent transcriptional regulator [Acidobacteriota bacterium]
MNTILLVEDKESLARMLQEALQSGELEVQWAASGTDAIRRLDERRFAAVLTDLRLPGADGLEVLRHAREADPDCPVIVMTGFATVENAVEAIKIGAFDFVQKPVDIDYLLILLNRAIEQRRLRMENLLLRDEFQQRHGIPPIIGDSAPMKVISEQIQKVAPTDSTVLLLGESGTGKELFARAIHKLSPRSNRPFVAINCAAIPDTLIENELFGHEKGSYTGAVSRQIGKFELADTGTIFLDEIAELGLGVQSKILRVIQERQFERIGGTSRIQVDIRIVCATNRRLDQEVSEGRFREDLFFRINVFPVVIPPLRERRTDIAALSDYFVTKFGRELGKSELRLSEESRQALENYAWPGNIRELENCLERAAILCDRSLIEIKDLNIGSREGDRSQSLRDVLDLSGTLNEASSRAASLVERLKISDALARTSSRADAADALGVSYRTLLTKLKEYGLD